MSFEESDKSPTSVEPLDVEVHDSLVDQRHLRSTHCPTCEISDCGHYILSWFNLEEENRHKKDLRDDYGMQYSSLKPTTGTCRIGVFVEMEGIARKASVHSRTLLRWGRDFWWSPALGPSILCSISRTWVKTWLLVCRRLQIFPKDVVLMIVSWIANTHACKNVALQCKPSDGKTCAYQQYVESHKLDDVKGFNIPFVCDPDFKIYPECKCDSTAGFTRDRQIGEWNDEGHVYYGQYANVLNSLATCEPIDPTDYFKKADEIERVYSGEPGPPPTVDHADLFLNVEKDV